MAPLLDALYALALCALSPWLAWRALRTGRYRRDLAAKLTGRVPVWNPAGAPGVWFHGVSVGEVHLLATLITAFKAARPGVRCVVSSTTDTGLTEARERFGAADVVAYPFDFSWACGAALDAVRPRLVVLAESELWPNFLTACRRRRIPVVVVNARVSPRSFARLRRVRGAADGLLLKPVAAFAAQSDETADRLRRLGVPAGKITVTGSVKYDGAAADRDTPKARALATLLGLGGPPVLVAGSTHAPEEAAVLAAVVTLRAQFPDLVTILVPRHPDRFTEVAGLVERSGLPWVRRNTLTTPVPRPPAVILLDTVGELGAAWALATVGFVGGSLDGRRGGQSMIEPAGCGVPAVFGPHVWNFRDAARTLVEAGGAVPIRSADGLAAALGRLLADADLRARMGRAAADLVRRQQGATGRTVELLGRFVGPA